MQTKDREYRLILFLAATVCVSCSRCAAAELPELMRRWEEPKTPVGTARIDESPGSYLRAAAEASPDRMRKVRAEYMNSSQVVAYLKSGGDIAILPLGSMEMHGFRRPLGTRTIIAHATAVLLGERWNALVFPPIRYSCVGATKRWTGTVSIPVDDTISYVRAVINGLLEMGFKRVVLLRSDRSFNLHGDFLVRSIHRESGHLPLYCEIDLLPNTPQVARELGAEPTDEIRVMAGLKILGHPGVFKPGEFKSNSGAPESEFARVRSRVESAQIDVLPVSDLPPGRTPLPEAIKQPDVDKAIAIMRREAKKLDKFPAEFARYQREVRSQLDYKPWSLENYARSMETAWAEAKRKPPDREVEPDQPVVEITERDNTDYRIPLSSLPEEATPEHKRPVRCEFMSATQVGEKLKRGEDLVILPVGAFEMHGPHGLLDTDTIQAHSRAIMVAGGWKALVMPPIHYVHTGATEFWAGTVSVSPDETIRYVRAVVEGLLDAGFKRVAILWFHYPGRLMARRIAREIYRHRGSVVFSIHPTLIPAGAMKERLGYRYGEDIGALAGVKILGHPGVFVVDEPEDVRGTWNIQAGWELRKMGVAGRPWYMRLPTQHLWVRSCVKSGDEDKLIDIMREAARQYADVPNLMGEYLDELRKLEKRAPWEWENWKVPGDK